MDPEGDTGFVATFHVYLQQLILLNLIPGR